MKNALFGLYNVLGVVEDLNHDFEMTQDSSFP